MVDRIQAFLSHCGGWSTRSTPVLTLLCFVCAVHFYFPRIGISFWLNNKQPTPPGRLSLSAGSRSVVRSRKDILHKVFKRSRCGVLRQTRLQRNEDSCVDGFVHLDIQSSSLRRNTHLRQHLLHLVIRELLVTQIRFAN